MCKIGRFLPILTDLFADPVKVYFRPTPYSSQVFALFSAVVLLKCPVNLSAVTTVSEPGALRNGGNIEREQPTSTLLEVKYYGPCFHACHRWHFVQIEQQYMSYLNATNVHTSATPFGARKWRMGQ